MVTRFLSLGLLIFLVYPARVFAVEKGVVDSGSTAWMLTSTALVLLMVPGLSMFYGGLVRTKNVLGTMMHSFVSMAV
ncbi:MAG: ammonium transporter, partial [Deltaproteobacteria bacterium]